MTNTNSRDLIRRLVDEFEGWIVHAEIEDIERAHDLIDEARAYLAQPEPEEPTDEEILALSHEHEVSYTMCDGHVIYPKQEGCDMRDDVLSFTRAVLARWGQ
jgi:hypothetical protein